MTDTAWRWAWPTWLAASATSFVVLEHAAFVQQKHPTLSRSLARWMRGRLGLVAFAAGWFALTAHLWLILEEGPR